MKKKSIRMVISISEAHMPEWFSFLSKISSGHVRAEVIRQHLMPPGTVTIFDADNDSKGNNLTANFEQQAQPGWAPNKAETANKEHRQDDHLPQDAHLSTAVDRHDPAVNHEAHDAHEAYGAHDAHHSVGADVNTQSEDVKDAGQTSSQEGSLAASLVKNGRPNW